MALFKSKQQWSAWCEHLWKKARTQWTERTGQDHLYRDTVVIPALVGIMAGLRFETLIELGSGDGAMTTRLMRALSHHAHPRHLVLLDRTLPPIAHLLRGIPRHIDLETHCVDLATKPSSWSFQRQPALTRDDRALWLSVFMLQELPTLRHLFGGLGQLMRPGEQFLAITVDPVFAEHLHHLGHAPVAGLGSLTSDFRYALRYPVPTSDDRIIFLPQFQRREDDYHRAAHRAALTLTGNTRLTVPSTPVTRRVFAATIYGRHILQQPSSLLLTFTKK